MRILVIKQTLVGGGGGQTGLLQSVGIVHDAVAAQGVAGTIAVGVDSDVIQIADAGDDVGVDLLKQARLIAGLGKALGQQGHIGGGIVLLSHQLVETVAVAAGGVHHDGAVVLGLKVGGQGLETGLGPAPSSNDQLGAAEILSIASCFAVSGVISGSFLLLAAAAGGQAQGHDQSQHQCKNALAFHFVYILQILFDVFIYTEMLGGEVKQNFTALLHVRIFVDSGVYHFLKAAGDLQPGGMALVGGTFDGAPDGIDTFLLRSPDVFGADGQNAGITLSQLLGGLCRDLERVSTAAEMP